MASCRAFLRLGGGPERDRDPVTRTGRDGWIEVVAWRHTVDSSRGSSATQLPSGESADDPLVIAKPVDEASRRLIAARLDDEVFAEAWLEIWRPITPGPDRRRPSREKLLEMPREEALEKVLDWLSRARAREELSYTIHLHNARIRRIETEMLAADSAASFPGPIEWVHIAYEKISWSWGPVDEEQEAAAVGVSTSAIFQRSGKQDLAHLVRAAAAKLQFVDGKSEYTWDQIWAEIQQVGPPHDGSAWKKKLEIDVGKLLQPVGYFKPPRYTLDGKIEKTKSDRAKLAKIVDELRNALA